VKFLYLYYVIKPLIPRRVQILVRRVVASHKRKRTTHIWPISPGAAKAPEGWAGWPDKKRFALVLNHDVDTAVGIVNSLKLMEIEKRLNFRSAFNIVPERYPIPSSVRQIITASDFDVAVHGLKHDGKLFKSRKIFDNSSQRINGYLEEWSAAGFTSPSMLRNLAWIAELDIEYGCSTFDTDPFEPDSEGMNTIFPFQVSNAANTKTYVELPYTLPQDHGLYVILREKDNKIWKEKLDWIAKNGGMALLNTHPDYMDFGSKPSSLEHYPVSLYVEFLEYIRARYMGQYWNALPRELARFWRSGKVEHTSHVRRAFEDSKPQAASAGEVPGFPPSHAPSSNHKT
jgi:hypothetical protein